MAAKQQLKDLESLLGSGGKEESELQTKKESYLRELDSLSKELKEAKDKNNLLKKNINEMGDNVGHSKSDLRTENEKKTSLERLIKKPRDDSEKLSGDLKSVGSQLDTSNMSAEELEEEIRKNF